MNKVLLIIKREYLSRVKKKAFIVMTFLVPILLIGMYAGIGYLTMQGGDTVNFVSVLDESGNFADKLHDTETVHFLSTEKNLEQAKKEIKQDDSFFLLRIPKQPDSSMRQVQLYSQKKPSFSLTGTIEEQIKETMKARMLVDAGIDPEVLQRIKPEVIIQSKELTEEGEQDSNSAAAYGIGAACAVLIYMSLFIYGAQVMRGVIEEKTNRIIEVVISSVKPFQLMLGKIIGIGLVGLTQFSMWILLTLALTTAASTFLTSDKSKKANTEVAGSMQLQTPQGDQSPIVGAVKAFEALPLGSIIPVFLTYFLGGYLLYSALFAAVGSAVDSETETQQFMFPITLPLLFTYILSFSFIINNPDSTLSFWLSIIPITSPIAMMVRFPFGVPAWELGLSISLLIAGFIFTTWVASRIYRVGILMYGKKSSYKELAKWFFYKE